MSLQMRKITMYQANVCIISIFFAFTKIDKMVNYTLPVKVALFFQQVCMFDLLQLSGSAF